MKKIIIGISIFLLSSVAWAGVDFDGIDDLITVGDADNLEGYTAISFGGWVKRNGAQPDSGFGTSFIKPRAGSQPVYCVFIKDAGARVRLNTVTDDSGLNSWEILNDFVSGEWHHFFVTWTSGEKPKIYFDGVSQSLSADGGTLTGTLVTSTDPLQFSLATLRYKGVVSEWYLYSAALTSTEVTMIANSKVKGIGLQIQPSSLKAYYPLDDQPDGASGDGDTFLDRSGLGHNATGNDGANNTGLTAKAEEVLSYP